MNIKQRGGYMRSSLQSLFILGIFLGLSINVQAQSETCSGNNTISVSGEAEVLVVPDEVILTLGVQTGDKVLRTAKSLNDEIVKKALAITRSAGISPQYTQTGYINIRPVYRDYELFGQFLGYSVRKVITIRLKEIAIFENLLTDLLEAGITHVHGIEFRTSELRVHRDTARRKAINAAKDKARALTREAGRTLCKINSIGEPSYGYWNPYDYYWGEGSRRAMSQNSTQVPGEFLSKPDSNTEMGQISVRATIHMSFSIE
jgi:uncharacterized protein